MQAEKKLKSGVCLDVREICKDVGKEFEVELDQSASDLIAEMVWKKILLYGADLEAFSKHAKRSMITSEDVKLLCRRNTSLMKFVEKECPSVSIKNEASTVNKRKRKASAIRIDD
ncbi:hypothetical protein AMK59_984 [Oryctes borbonicus]|uniref:Centromere protein S n=1 Tax=Oryctes borbonicus TaxID=1629725 RepID=A0A0T6BEY4_9SCAR|nr:hypothetical protein AMK59_984 [Oryctes borbonicus]